MTILYDGLSHPVRPRKASVSQQNFSSTLKWLILEVMEATGLNGNRGDADR